MLSIYVKSFMLLVHFLSSHSSEVISLFSLILFMGLMGVELALLTDSILISAIFIMGLLSGLVVLMSFVIKMSKSPKTKSVSPPMKWLFYLISMMLMIWSFKDLKVYYKSYCSSKYWTHFDLISTHPWMLGMAIFMMLIMFLMLYIVENTTSFNSGKLF